MKSVIASFLGLVLVASVQAAPPNQWFAPSDGTPVDQAVGDLDPLGTSLRRLHGGLRSDGEHTSLFRVEVAPDLDRPHGRRLGYYRVAPGLRALVMKQDYLVPLGDKHIGLNIASKHDGVFFELDSADTVYDLRTTAVTPQTSNLGPDRRIDGRINARIETRINAQVDGRAWE